MTIKNSFLLNIVLLTLSKSEQILCSENNTLLETMGDAILTVFVDANYGQYCNISSSKGLQQISTALDVVRTLNKYDYVPGVKLGVRVLDTCHDKIIVFKQVLRVILEQNCAPNYEMGVLVPSQYSSMMNFFHDYDDLPIVAYEERNFTMPTIDILAHYLSTEYEVIDLVHTNVSSVHERFLEVTRDVGVCVKRHDKRVDDDRNENVTEAVIVAIGERDDIQRWLGESEDSKDIRRTTWLLLPLDNSDIDDLIPPGSYVIKPKTSGFDLDKFSNVNEFLEKTEDSMNDSPYLLDIGKAIIELAEVFQEVRRGGCPIDGDDKNHEENCIMTQFRPQSQREIRDSDVYKVLRMQLSSHSVRYAVAMKTQHELVDVALYEIEVSELRVLPAKTTSGMPGLCLENLVGNCKNCTNFQKRSEERKVITKDIIDRNVLKNSVYVPIFLIAIVCGTLACCVIVILIVRRFARKETFDGNPTFTFVLVLANTFTLLTALPFCLTDDYFGAENLNARKILHTALAFGFTFSIMLSRALFLALSVNDVFVAHLNGYLHSLMAFFMSGVQIAMSVTYFILNTKNSAVVARSLIFIALLGYDIFLLISLFVASCFITQIQRNYYEGKCFFGTAIGLLVVWAVWLICFMVMQSENRDTVVSFGIIGTAYSIILGILIPKIYYMITYPLRRKDLGQRFNLPVNLPTDSIVRQSRSSYEYVHPVRENQILRMSTYSDYYGNPNPSSKRLDRCESPHHREMSGYGNHGFQAEMKEIDAVHIAPRICIESLRNLEVASNDVIYAQPRIYRSQRVVLREESNAEMCICDRDNSSPTLRIYNEIYPMRYASPTNMISEQRIDEEDENEDEENEEEQKDRREDEDLSRVTRL